MQKLILRCRYTLGDVVLLTAAVRDVHRCWPGRFQTDVRTAFPDVWTNNRYLIRLDEYEPKVRVIDCDMPLIEQSDRAGKHCLHGFIDFLSDQLALKLRLTEFRGDIHLSEEESASTAPVVNSVRLDFPYWLINAGGKHDCTIKWWDTARYQEVVDHFSGRIQFVQVGLMEHWHPPLRGVLDLRGRTKVRDLIQLVRHADGVVCGVTALMHLAAAVPVRSKFGGTRPCVVIAGGREAPHWGAYPGHQFISTVGILRCCASGGCWKLRTKPLGDGDSADKEICLDVRGELPACMDLIRPEEVIRRIEFHLSGGNFRPLCADDEVRALHATQRLNNEPPPAIPANFYNAPQAGAAFIARIPPYPAGFAGRGIVICGGGVRMFTNAWVCIQMLRKLGCRLPIELWHLGKAEMDATMEELMRPLDVRCIDATKNDSAFPAKITVPLALKPFAMINSGFEQVLLLDADNVPVRDPEFLFESELFKKYGAVLWPHGEKLSPESTAWKVFNVPHRDEPRIDSGQALVDKRRCWAPLLLCMWYNEQNAFFYKHAPGHMETLRFAFHRLGATFAVAPPAVKLDSVAVYQHDFDGGRLFQHRSGDKWDILGRNRPIPGFVHEDECLGFVANLAERWDGQFSWLKENHAKALRALQPGKLEKLKLAVAMGSCEEREAVRVDTLKRLADIGCSPENVFLAVDQRRFPTRQENITHTGWCALRMALETDAEYVLYLEDDLDFNQHLLRNLSRWGPLTRRELRIGGLCNFGFPELAWDIPDNSCLVHPNQVFGSQAMLLSREMIEFCLEHWGEGRDEFDMKLTSLAIKARQPVFYHCPSLVQHVGRESTIDTDFVVAPDFDAEWKSTARPVVRLEIATRGGAAKLV